MDYLNRNAGAFQAIGAILTVLLAVGALVGVKVQVDSAEAIQRAQSARDIYREFLALSANKPEFAQPNYCQLADSPNNGAYESYVEYLLYTAEQVTAVEPDWQDTFAAYFAEHAPYICGIDDASGYSDAVAGIITAFKTKGCAAVVPCN